MTKRNWHKLEGRLTRKVEGFQVNEVLRVRLRIDDSDRKNQKCKTVEKSRKLQNSQGYNERHYDEVLRVIHAAKREERRISQLNERRSKRAAKKAAKRHM